MCACVCVCVCVRMFVMYIGWPRRTHPPDTRSGSNSCIHFGVLLHCTRPPFGPSGEIERKPHAIEGIASHGVCRIGSFRFVGGRLPGLFVVNCLWYRWWRQGKGKGKDGERDRRYESARPVGGIPFTTFFMRCSFSRSSSRIFSATFSSITCWTATKLTTSPPAARMGEM